MCEIRFTTNAKDGKLEGMIECIPNGLRTEVTKEALKYFLCAVRDSKIESDYMTADMLADFKTDVKENLFTVEDLFRILDTTRGTQTVHTVQAVTTNVAPTESQQVNNTNDTKEIVKTLDNEDEFDLDLSNEFDDNSDGSIDIDFDEESFGGF